MQTPRIRSIIDVTEAQAYAHMVAARAALGEATNLLRRAGRPDLQQALQPALTAVIDAKHRLGIELGELTKS